MCQSGDTERRRKGDPADTPTPPPGARTCVPEQVDEIARRIVDHVPTYPISYVCQLEDTDPETARRGAPAPYERAPRGKGPRPRPAW